MNVFNPFDDVSGRTDLSPVEPVCRPGLIDWNDLCRNLLRRISRVEPSKRAQISEIANRSLLEGCCTEMTGHHLLWAWIRVHFMCWFETDPGKCELDVVEQYELLKETDLFSLELYALEKFPQLASRSDFTILLPDVYEFNNPNAASGARNE